jgi:hypothetical protein
MRKLKLQIDNLAVESFPTAAAAREEAGTVHGAAGTRNCPSAVTSCRYDDGMGGIVMAAPACTCPVIGTV